jgi:hypothetical protein
MAIRNLQAMINLFFDTSREKASSIYDLYGDRFLRIHRELG